MKEFEFCLKWFCGIAGGIMLVLVLLGCIQAQGVQKWRSEHPVQAAIQDVIGGNR